MRRTARCLLAALAVITASCGMLAAVAAVAAALWQIDLASGWAATAQPVATAILTVALVSSTVVFSRTIAAQRTVLTTHRQLDLEPATVHELRGRRLEAARMLAAENPTLRLVAVHELLAVADEWCRMARRSARPQRMLLEHQRCIDLICGYLRANHRLERFVPGTSVGAGVEHDERIVREQLCAGLTAHLTTWKHLGPFQVDLSGADLAGMTLRDSSLAGLVARASVLIEADLSGSDLAGADLKEALATNTRFTDTHLAGATLAKVAAPNASFTGADLSDADLTDAVLRGAKLLSATLDRTDLTGADLKGAKLMRADLRTATWGSADFIGADLTEALPSSVRERSTAATNAARK
ncbi:pentapeptide repeat-containing protein [Rhodococcus pyridinivorans]|uniref:pentapeptide repeat-containing protein n=1 Tax=Rhodococcus pyridinivorans TaxID=103816 RepID=UPI0020791CB0|nr:pentapeptide repeat-containing protein [Rhodococcus pyridinivorans]USI88404.1 pentapeptide repeat-containing protein [Rhodococcus pyridinivorans]